MHGAGQGQIFGRVNGDVHVVEFQKRSLPHAHILVILDRRDRPHTPDDFERIVSAERTNPVSHPELYESVRRHMVQRPCGIHNQNAACMMTGRTRLDETAGSKHSPRPFTDQTTINEETGYVVYRRQASGRFYPPGITARSHQNNTWVVPYHPYLPHKYQALINVEICTSARNVEYVYKYVYKGHDRANVRVEDGTQVSEEDRATALKGCV